MWRQTLKKNVPLLKTMIGDRKVEVFFSALATTKTKTCMDGEQVF